MAVQSSKPPAFAGRAATAFARSGQGGLCLPSPLGCGPASHRPPQRGGRWLVGDEGFEPPTNSV